MTTHSPEALCGQGTRLTNRRRHPGDIARGIALLKRAHRLGAICASHNLAIAYSEQGNRRRCAYWLRQSLKTAMPARFLLAIAHAAGYGVRRDPAEAARLFREVVADPAAFPFEREESLAFLSMLRRHLPIRVTGSIGRTHPAPCPPPAVFPMIGNIFSIHWKTAENFFKSLEKIGEFFQPLEKYFPIIGKLRGRRLAAGGRAMACKG